MRNINDECYGPQLPSETPSTDIHSHTYYQLWGAGAAWALAINNLQLGGEKRKGMKTQDMASPAALTPAFAKSD